jgi:general secretion pathway protein K
MRVGRRTRRGMAIVVVLWTVVLLATVTAVASSAARSSASVATNVRATATARSMAESAIIAASSRIDDALHTFPADDARRGDFLSRLEPSTDNALPYLQDTLGDGVFAVTVVDVSSRLDVNNAGVDGLARLFATATTPPAARRMAELIDAALRGDDRQPDDERRRARDSLNALLLGRELQPRRRRPFETLDDVALVPGIDVNVLARVAPLLTVDGDGNVNRRGASRDVLASASGSLVDAPSRLLLIARGWQRGHPLTRQIEAVYDVGETGLRLVRWRERAL